MDFIAPLEHWLVNVYARLLKLPNKLTLMAARCMWVLCAFSVVISAGSVYASLGLIQTVSHAGSHAVELYGITPEQARLNGGLAIAYFTAAAILQALAVLPLKRRSITGWRLLLLSVCAAAVVSITTSVYPFTPTAIAISIGLFVVVFYFLVQLHPHFEAPAKPVKLAKPMLKKAKTAKKKNHPVTKSK